MNILNTYWRGYLVHRGLERYRVVRNSGLPDSFWQFSVVQECGSGQKKSATIQTANWNVAISIYVYRNQFVYDIAVLSISSDDIEQTMGGSA